MTVTLVRHDERVPRTPTALVGRQGELDRLLTAVGLLPTTELPDRTGTERTTQRTTDRTAGTTGSHDQDSPVVSVRAEGPHRPSAGRSGGAVLLAGDAGIGKTRILRELAARVRAAGVRTIAGQCVDLGDTPPPYLPFAEMFGRLATDEPDVAGALLAQIPALARLLPGRSETGAEPRLDRGELFESVASALGVLASERPLLVIIEDVHWADRASQDLIGFLFTRLGSGLSDDLAIVVSYRSDDLHRRHPLRPALAGWSRLNVETVTLNPLPDTELRRLVDLRLAESGAAPRGPELAGIVRRAAGNAFFAEELVDALGTGDEGDELPWHLADLLLVRLDALSDDARELARLAAVAGRRVDHDALATVAGLGPREFDRALREVVDAHILEPTSSGRGYGFRHALLAEAVYDDLLPGERTRIHGAYAAMLAAAQLSRPAELARHALRSGDRATALAASIEAGDRALDLAAPDEALQHYETAIELVTDDDDTAAQLVMNVVEAAVSAGHHNRAIKFASNALAEEPGDASVRARARRRYAFAVATLVGEPELDTWQATREALELMDDEPAGEFKARLASLHALVSLALGRRDEAGKWAVRATEIAEDAGVPGAAADARNTLGLLLRGSDPEAALKQIDDAAEQARAVGDIAAEIRSQANRAAMLLEAGDLEQGRAAYAETVELGRRHGRPWSLHPSIALVNLVMIDINLGDWDRAEAVLRAHPTRDIPREAAARLRAVDLRRRAYQGDDAVIAEAGEQREFWQLDGMIAINGFFAVAEIHAQQGRSTEAAALLGEPVRRLGEIWNDPYFTGRIELSANALTAHVLAAQNAGGGARGELVAAGADIIAAARATEADIRRIRPLGLEARAWFARAEAEWARLRWVADVDPPPAEELIARWRETVSAFDYGNVYELARARARLAAVLKATGDSAGAQELADLAREVAHRTGSAPLQNEVRGLGTTARPRSTRPDGELTAREAEVLVLVAGGRSNREIGRRLYISDKTVSVHVSNIMAKLGAGSRTEAAAIARRDGLIDA